MRCRTSTRNKPLVPTLMLLALSVTEGWSDRYATYFQTYADAKRAGALGPGKWLPAFLPASATEIREEHDIDTNELWVAFTLGRDFSAPSSCSPSLDKAVADDRGPQWWRQAAKAMGSPIQFYQCTNATELGGYWARSDCSLWTSPYRAVYRCSSTTLDPKHRDQSSSNLGP
jgi:hypothetical protein